MATARAAAIPVECEVLLDGHDGDLVSLATGVFQDPVDHGLLVGAVGEPHTPAGLTVGVASDPRCKRATGVGSSKS
jgi:hypothetical protein